MHSVDMYTQNAGEIISDQFVIEHHAFVKKIALHIKHRLPSHVGLEDLLQAGFVGLLEAHKSFKDNLGASFETYAGIRVRGAIFDALRKNSWCTRETSRQMRTIANAITTIEQREQKQATAEDIIIELNTTPEEYARICQQISVSNVVSLDLIDSENALFGDDEENPQLIIQEDDLKQNIKKSLSNLPEREQLVLSLYYVDELTFKQIGEVLGLTEARICQLHSQAITRMKNKMRLKNL
jgi:RNA polymerase sigma factor FliA